MKTEDMSVQIKGGSLSLPCYSNTLLSWTVLHYITVYCLRWDGGSFAAFIVLKENHCYLFYSFMKYLTNFMKKYDNERAKILLYLRDVSCGSVPFGYAVSLTLQQNGMPQSSVIWSPSCSPHVWYATRLTMQATLHLLLRFRDEWRRATESDIS